MSPGRRSQGFRNFKSLQVVKALCIGVMPEWPRFEVCVCVCVCVCLSVCLPPALPLLMMLFPVVPSISILWLASGLVVPVYRLLISVACRVDDAAQRGVHLGQICQGE
jgi:hypothetical protein